MKNLNCSMKFPDESLASRSFRRITLMTRSLCKIIIHFHIKPLVNATLVCVTQGRYCFSGIHESYTVLLHLVPSVWIFLLATVLGLCFSAWHKIWFWFWSLKWLMMCCEVFDKAIHSKCQANVEDSLKSFRFKSSSFRRHCCIALWNLDI